MLHRLEVAEWRGRVRVPQEALCWTQTIIQAEFWYLSRQSRSHFLQNYIREELSLRARTSFFVPYQNMEMERIALRYRRLRYVLIPDLWNPIKVCWGCFVELSLVPMYTGSTMLEDLCSGHWSDFIPEWEVRTLANILAKACDQYRLWSALPRLRRSIRSLDMKIAVEGEAIQEEKPELLVYID